MRPLIIAHRGYSSKALENSLEAVQLALSVPVDMIELDLRASRDDVLYVMHDKLTGRTAERNIDIERAISRDIDLVRLRNSEEIPRLRDVLELVGGRTAINVEIKSDYAGELLARELSRGVYHGPLMVSSFKAAEVEALHNALPDIPCGLVYDTFSPRHVDDYRSRGYGLISLRKNTVTEHLVRACHLQHIEVYVWTVDREEEMKRCIDWGVDAIYTNKPGLLKDVREKGRSDRGNREK